MHRILGLLCGAFCAGACAVLVEGPPSAERVGFIAAMLSVGAPLVVTLWLRLCRRCFLLSWRRSSGRLVTVYALSLTAAFSLGISYCSARVQNAEGQTAVLASLAAGRGTKLVVGRIDGAVERTDKDISCPLLIDGWYGRAGFVRSTGIRVWLTISSGKEKFGQGRRFRLRFYTAASELQTGDFIAVYAYLRPVPRGPFAVALLRKGIRFVAAGSIYGVNRIRYAGGGWDGGVAQGMVQEWIAQRAVAVYGKAAAAWVLAFAVGDRQGIPSTLLKTMASLGFVHAVVASGATIRMTVDPPVRWIRRRRGRKPPGWYTTGVLLTGMVLVMTGFAPPAVRAAVVYMYDLTAKALQRKGDRFTANGMAAVVLVLLQPTSLLDPGVWLSYAAVATLSRLPKRLEGGALRWIRPGVLRRIIARGFAAELGITPFAANLFGQFSILSLGVNVLLYPVLEWVTPVCFALVAAAALMPGSASVAGPWLTGAAGVLTSGISRLGQMPLVIKLPRNAYVGLLVYEFLLLFWAEGLKLIKKTHNGLYSDKRPV